jgi:hypothetical protein
MLSSHHGAEAIIHWFSFAVSNMGDGVLGDFNRSPYAWHAREIVRPYCLSDQRKSNAENGQTRCGLLNNRL